MFLCQINLLLLDLSLGVTGDCVDHFASNGQPNRRAFAI